MSGYNIRHGAYSGRSKSDTPCDACEWFIEFIKLLGSIDSDQRLFPKQCRVCGRQFFSFPEYVSCTSTKGHAFEDCREVMGRPFTMMYRHCPCGNTLVLTFTEEIIPTLDEFWRMLRREAEKSGRPLREVVAEFGHECDRYMSTLFCALSGVNL
jgi:hypothetical protein